MNPTNDTQKTGLVGTTVPDDDTELVGSRIARIDPNIINQSGAAMEDGDADEETEDDGGLLTDEPVDENGDPTGEHDYDRDDNYALGGKVAR